MAANQDRQNFGTKNREEYERFAEMILKCITQDEPPLSGFEYADFTFDYYELAGNRAEVVQEYWNYVEKWSKKHDHRKAWKPPRLSTWLAANGR